MLRPRPWTRAQSRWAAELHQSLPPGPILELCCGVGHIGLLAIRDTGRSGTLVDANASACAHARANAIRAGLSELVSVLEHRLDGAPIPGLELCSPLVIADPPYVPSEHAAGLTSDPMPAVDGGHDGLDVVSTVLRSASHHLAPGGACLLQVHGPAQADAIERRLAAEWGDVQMAPSEVRSFGSDRAVLLLTSERRAESAGGRPGRGGPC